jgi:integrase/recombinase XerD
MVTAPIRRGTELGLQVYLTKGAKHLSSAPFVCPICPFLPLQGDSDYPQGMEPFGQYHDDLFNRDLAPKTKMRYWQVVITYRKWLGDRSPDIAAAKEFLAWLSTRGYRPRSILLYYHALRLFFDFLGQPFKLKLRKPKELPPYHDQSDVERLIVQAERGLRGQKPWQKQRNKILILTLAYTGLRKGELLNLTVSDIDFARRLILVRQGKGRKDRVIPMSERIIVPLRQLCNCKAAGSKVFDGLNARSVYRIVTSLAKACSLDGFHPHSLRHFFATQLVEKGANLRAVQELLGHADLTTTAVYLDVSPRHLRETVALLDDVGNRSAPENLIQSCKEFKWAGDPG